MEDRKRGLGAEVGRPVLSFAVGVLARLHVAQSPESDAAEAEHPTQLAVQGPGNRGCELVGAQRLVHLNERLGAGLGLDRDTFGAVRP